MARLTAPLTLGLAFFACGSSEAEPNPPQTVDCARFAPPESRGVPNAPALVEVSGLASSGLNDNVLWAHADSGASATLYAISTSGELLSEVTVEGAAADDWEDIGAGPCPRTMKGPCLWIGDLGANVSRSTPPHVVVVEEPRIQSSDRPRLASVKALNFELRYPGDTSIPDIEALAVAPDGSGILLLEKTDSSEARVYFATQVDSQLVAEEIGTFAAPGISIFRGKSITAADWHPGGQRIIVRVYTGIYEYGIGGSGRQAAEALLSAAPTVVALGPLAEPQGEALTYSRNGDSLYTMSEEPSQARVLPLLYYGCESRAPSGE